jgi:hypothetical protein
MKVHYYINPTMVDLNARRPYTMKYVYTLAAIAWISLILLHQICRGKIENMLNMKFIVPISSLRSPLTLFIIISLTLSNLPTICLSFSVYTLSSSLSYLLLTDAKEGCKSEPVAVNKTPS